ncbi:MAG: kinase/pyrophosphorylase [Thiothrix sp.]|nr:kinase/pyrophosphorylase [Thiothrix sp.]HPQ94336.1 pyruvate, water dikinase regulatory protein [Thiolinea sp.]
MQKQRSVFYLSDRTGITAETLGHSLLTQFDGIEWRRSSVPFLDSVDKAHELAERINQAAHIDGCRPLVFSTLIDEEVRAIVQQADCVIYDFFGTFIDSMEQELQQKSAHAVGRSHGVQNNSAYFNRIAAINYTLSNDDGVSAKNFADADIILIGVSRSGKTPTCLYMALQYGISAANYPLTEEDMESMRVPKILEPFRNKLFGLTLSAGQLHRIRQERRPNSRYAALNQCQSEIQWQESLYRMAGIPFIDTSNISIEEISTTILNRSGLRRQLYGQ